MSSHKNILISKDDLAFLLEGDLSVFDQLTQNCYCVQCKDGYHHPILNYTIQLNDLCDIELNGFCGDCGHAMNRYMEFGNNPAFAAKAQAFLTARNAAQAEV